MGFQKYILLYILVPLILLFIGASFVRFIVRYDYMVSYEGDCNPALSSCFIGCVDDECTEEYYFKKMEKYAADLYAQCGKDITNCESANECLFEDDQTCLITYCDPEVDGEDCRVQSEEQLNDGEIESQTIKMDDTNNEHAI